MKLLFGSILGNQLAFFDKAVSETTRMVNDFTQGGQKWGFKDTLQTPLKSFGIDPDTGEGVAQDQTAWRINLHKSLATYEESRTLVAEVRIHNRKTYYMEFSPEIKIPYPHC